MSARLLPFRPPSGGPPAEGKDPLARLTKASAEGDRKATRTLITAVMPAILRAARGVLGVHHADVEDVAQDAAMALLRALPHFEGKCSVTHYASRICVQTALSARRKMKVRGEGRHVELDEGVAAADQSPADVLLSSYRRQILRELCDELPEAQSEALVLHFVVGMTLDEVAAASSVPRNTVRSRLRLAKESLRERIGGDVRLREVLTGGGVR